MLLFSGVKCPGLPRYPGTGRSGIHHESETAYPRPVTWFHKMREPQFTDLVNDETVTSRRLMPPRNTTEGAMPRAVRRSGRRRFPLAAPVVCGGVRPEADMQELVILHLGERRRHPAAFPPIRVTAGRSALPPIPAVPAGVQLGWIGCGRDHGLSLGRIRGGRRRMSATWQPRSARFAAESHRRGGRVGLRPRGRCSLRAGSRRWWRRGSNGC